MAILRELYRNALGRTQYHATIEGNSAFITTLNALQVSEKDAAKMFRIFEAVDLDNSGPSTLLFFPVPMLFSLLCE
eukprot:scaffold7041_cov311-Pinguiococcus_pyrenoidosus.AAC.7